MDILNFISWIKAGEYRTTLPTDTSNLIAIGAKDPSRDDGYRPMAINAAPLQSLYDTANVAQASLITNAVTVNALNGVITTVTSTLAAATTTFFTVNNSDVLATSKILLTVEYDEVATGFPVVRIADIAAGSFKVVLSNVSAAAALNAALRIHFLIIQ
jgi:hypothetical protein